MEASDHSVSPTSKVLRHACSRNRGSSYSLTPSMDLMTLPLKYGHKPRRKLAMVSAVTTNCYPVTTVFFYAWQAKSENSVE